MAQSSTVRQIGPNLSIDQLNAIAPVRGTRPNVGRKPVSPHSDEGETIEPSVSEPIAKGKSPAATEEAEPAEDPEEPRLRFQGFLVVPPNQTSPQANSPKVNLAQRTAPDFSNLSTTTAS